MLYQQVAELYWVGVLVLETIIVIAAFIAVAALCRKFSAATWSMVWKCAVLSALALSVLLLVLPKTVRALNQSKWSSSSASSGSALRAFPWFAAGYQYKIQPAGQRSLEFDSRKSHTRGQLT